MCELALNESDQTSLFRLKTLISLRHVILWVILLQFRRISHPSEYCDQPVAFVASILIAVTWVNIASLLELDAKYWTPTPKREKDSPNETKIF